MFMFHSTRGNKLVSSYEAILDGIAKDGGLYVIDKMPKVEAVKEKYEVLYCTEYVDEFALKILGKYEDLDIEIDRTSNPRAYYDSNEFDFDLSNGIRCAITRNSKYAVCSKKFWGIKVGYYKTLDTNKPLWCITAGLERTNMANRLCSEDTGRDSNAIQCYSGSCYYPY